MSSDEKKPKKYMHMTKAERLAINPDYVERRGKNKKRKITDENDIFQKLSSDELEEIIIKNSPLFDLQQLSRYLVMNVADLKDMSSGKPKKRKRSIKKYELFANWLLYVPPIEKPRSFKAYREALLKLNRCFQMQKLCEFYGFNFYKYRMFMEGNNYAMTKQELDLLIKAMKLRPLNKLDMESVTSNSVDI